LHKLSASFVLGYHGCDKSTADKLVAGEEFKPSENDYDWLGKGTYFWEANPLRGLEFAGELKRLKRGANIKSPAVVGAVIDLGLCLDLTTTIGVQHVQDAYRNYIEIVEKSGYPPPRNSSDSMQRKLDCAVINNLHKIRQDSNFVAVESVRAVFTEGKPIFDGSGFLHKTHVQICVCNPECIKGVFRVPQHQLL